MPRRSAVAAVVKAPEARTTRPAASKAGSPTRTTRSTHDRVASDISQVVRPVSVRTRRERELVLGFLDGLRSSRQSIDSLSVDAAHELGVGAGRSALGSFRWSRLVGDRLSTADVVELLGVSRQALSKRIQSGSVLALPGARTTWYPTWQFDRTRREVRPCVRYIMAEFRDTLGTDANRFTIATWMNAARPDLAGESPASWIARGRPPATVLELAGEFAAQLAQ